MFKTWRPCFRLLFDLCSASLCGWGKCAFRDGKKKKVFPKGLGKQASFHEVSKGVSPRACYNGPGACSSPTVHKVSCCEHTCSGYYHHPCCSSPHSLQPALAPAGPAQPLPRAPACPSAGARGRPAAPSALPAPWWGCHGVTLPERGARPIGGEWWAHPELGGFGPSVLCDTRRTWTAYSSQFAGGDCKEWGSKPPHSIRF